MSGGGHEGAGGGAAHGKVALSDRAPPLGALALLLPLAAVAAVAGNEMVVVLGVVANPGIAGVLAGMALARLPARLIDPRTARELPTLAQAAAAAAALAAGQALLLPIGVPFALGRPDLVAPMFLGACLALLVDGWLIWRLFAGPAFPADAAWPQGTAAAAVVHAAREGERPGTVVLVGMAVGAVGGIYRAPMAAFGVALLGNPWVLGMFAAGVLLRAHGAPLLGWLGPGGDLLQAQVPQGMLAGAAVVALGQVALPGLRAHAAGPARRALATAAVAHLAIALLLAFAGGLATAMPPAMLALFVAFAAFGTLLHTLVVGLATMHTGWAPSLAAAMLVLTLGMLIGFPPPALALLAGLAVAAGPGLAATGQAFKAAAALGGSQAERRRQFHLVMAAFALAGGVVWLSHRHYLDADLVPPGARVFAIAIQAGVAREIAAPLALWAAAGAMLQLAGGMRRQLGVMLATGLLLLAPAIGWAVVAGLLLRALLLHRGGRHRADIELFGAGVIAGDILVALGDAIGRAYDRR